MVRAYAVAIYLSPVTRTNQRKIARQLSAPIAISAVFILGALIPRPPIVNALTHGALSGVHLETPVWYRILAPVSDVFDALTLLSIPQVISVFVFVLAVAAAARIVSTISRSRSGQRPVHPAAHLRFAANVVGAFVAVAGLALLTIRPMAAVKVDDPNLVAVDFHSHTSASHDGRPTFPPEQNREWHRRAGFDVAYVTDHHTFVGANSAMASNPPSSGNGVVLLPGLEYRDGDEHVLAIGLDPRRTDPVRHEWHPINDSQKGVGSDFKVPPLLILCLPGNVHRIPADEEIGVARLSGIELSDGSPPGLQQGASDFPSIVALAQRRNLALVAGSDNHGWGHTAAAWTILRIPGWRSMSPNVLDTSIRRTLLTRGNLATEVVSRRLPPAASKLSIALTAPAIALGILRDIGWGERLSWIAWTWAICLAVVFVRRRISIHLAGAEWLVPENVEGTGEDLIVGVSAIRRQNEY